MGIVKLYNKERGVTYVYESISYWDKEKKQPRSKRKLIGKIDPDTGEIVPTSPRKKKTEYSDNDYRKMYEAAARELSQKDQRIETLEALLAKCREDEQKFLGRLESAIKDRSDAILHQKNDG